MCSTVCLFSASSYTEVMLSGYLLMLLWAVTFLPSSFLLLHPSVVGFITLRRFWNAAGVGVSQQSQNPVWDMVWLGMERQEWEGRGHSPVSVTVPGAPAAS